MKQLNYCLAIVVMLAFLACRPVADAKMLSDAPPRQNAPAEATIESDEQKAVRLAEEFIKRNGYTSAPADRKNLSHETVEFSQSIDELLELRKNSLEEKAFGVSPHGRTGEKGWTVVFRYAKRIRDEQKEKTDWSATLTSPAGR